MQLQSIKRNRFELGPKYARFRDFKEEKPTAENDGDPVSKDSRGDKKAI